MKDLLAPDDTRDALRKLGGLLFGLGMVMVAIRKESDYSDFVLFLIYLIPAAFLYGEGVFTDKFTGGIRPWQAVYSVFGLILVPFALGQFVEMLDGTFSGWNTVWIFAVTAALAFYAGAVKGIRFQLLAGSILAIVVWSAFWNEILADGIARDFGIYRGLLGILSIILLAGALYLWRTGPDARVTGTVVNDGGDQKIWKASELLTGAGISAVLACSLGISSFAQFVTPFGVDFTIVETAAHWDILLLLISLGLVGLGTTDRDPRARLHRRNRPGPLPAHRRARPRRRPAPAGQAGRLADRADRARAPRRRAGGAEGGQPGRPAPRVPEGARQVAPPEDQDPQGGDVARRFLAALSEGDSEAVGALVHPEVEIKTERTVHRGREAAVEWSAKRFDHIHRRYVPLEIEQVPGGVRVAAELQYVWRESARVGDTTAVTIDLGLRDGLISSWELTEVEGLREI